MPSTVNLHRVIKTTPEKLYRAFTEPDAKCKWIPPDGFTCTVHEWDPVIGGTYKMSFRNFTTGASHGFGGEFLEMTPHSRLRYTDVFDDPNLPGTIEVTVEITPVACGCDLNITQAGIPDMIPPEMCYLGWQDSLSNLAKLVEPDIPM